MGFDDGDAARRALDRAIAETAPGDELVVLVVDAVPIDLLTPRTRGALVESEDVPVLPPEPPQVTRTLADARDILARHGLEASLEWAAGDPGAAIVDVARVHEADLIVVGAHHHSRLQRFLGEDTAAEVARLAEGCEVISVP